MLLSLVMDEAIREIALAAPFTTLASIEQQLLQRFPGVPISLSTVAQHLDGHDISTKIADKDADVSFQRNSPETVEWQRQYGQWLASLNINHRLIYVDEFFTHQMIGCTPVGERVRREVAPRGRNMNVIVAINQKMGLVLVNQASELFPGEDHIHIIYDGARSHLNIVVPEPYKERLTLRMLSPYSSFLNLVEQAQLL